MRIAALITLRAGRESFPPGSVLDVDEAEGERLLASGFAEPAAPTEPEDVQLFRACNAKDAIELIDGTTDAALLAQFLTIEQARKEPRKTVLEALDARRAALAAA